MIRGFLSPSTLLVIGALCINDGAQFIYQDAIGTGMVGVVAGLILLFVGHSRIEAAK